ncbi:hypothetical protein [uncultured Agrobacterium sp.]|uniref:hypothetical protein n=1 Tax=uncultured Agrobacterium sp. TaxID=157277 RepID=UPI0025F3DF90|nr:hypothetical protein [uncultured Agrobacterium sp.]
MAQAPKRPKFTSPKGTFKFPKLTEPDTKFKPEGEYSVKLLLDTDSPEAQKLIRQIDEAAAESLAESKAKAKNAAEAKKWETKSVPYADVLDEETGEPTGVTEFSFKMTASGTSKKTGKDWTRKPALFDAKGQPIKGAPKIGGGTIGKVSYELMKWGTLQLGASVKLALEAAQIIELRTWGEQSASSYGFGEEEGYEYASGGEFGDETDGDDTASDQDDTDETPDF